ncbi:hypothetical protein Hdeb2414_s0015g00447901 [Helianthus debilis subsp. tardiflorus]
MIGGLDPGTSHASRGFPHVVFWGCDSKTRVNLNACMSHRLACKSYLHQFT